jgi:hypothetical protein
VSLGCVPAPSPTPVSAGRAPSRKSKTHSNRPASASPEPDRQGIARTARTRLSAWCPVFPRRSADSEWWPRSRAVPWEESTGASAIGVYGDLLTRATADSVPLMKAAFAALLLLFQLQPVLGTVACLGLSDRPAKQECEMPEHSKAATTHITISDVTHQTCQLAAICTLAPPAVPALSKRFDVAVPLYEGAPTLAATLPLGISPAPPFHPPRA